MNVFRLGRHRLADIPKLDDAIPREAEEMDDSGTSIVGLLLNVRVNGHQIAIFERSKNVQPLLRVLPGALFHARDQCIRVTSEERVVMAETRSDVCLEGLPDATGSRQHEKRHRSIFVGHRAIRMKDGCQYACDVSFRMKSRPAEVLLHNLPVQAGALD